uniref:Zgc:174906 n=1 Tax=Cynoglossus semilaevis TaxID=244447 RepID=A0A3P8VBR4_CYNSE
MADEPASEVQLLRKHKAQLIDILSADADFVLQHADSRCLLSSHGYQQVKACRIPSEKVTELLDHVIQRSPEAAQGFLQLLKEQSLQETFPLLEFVKDLQVTTLSSVCGLVTEKQMMKVAKAIGKSWREIGRLALDIPSVKLEQIEEDNTQHVERVFAMLRLWRTCQREKATAAQLHVLLSRADWALPPEEIDFLLQNN